MLGMRMRRVLESRNHALGRTHEIGEVSLRKAGLRAGLVDHLGDEDVQLLLVDGGTELRIIASDAVEDLPGRRALLRSSSLGLAHPVCLSSSGGGYRNVAPIGSWRGERRRSL